MTTNTEKRSAELVLADARAMVGGAQYNKKAVQSLVAELVGAIEEQASQAATAPITLGATEPPGDGGLGELLGKLADGEDVFPCPGASKDVAAVAFAISELQKYDTDIGDGTPQLAMKVLELEKQIKTANEAGERVSVLLAEATAKAAGLTTYSKTLEEKIAKWKEPTRSEDDIREPVVEEGAVPAIMRDARAYAGGADGSRGDLVKCIRNLPAVLAGKKR